MILGRSTYMGPKIESVGTKLSPVSLRMGTMDLILVPICVTGVTYLPTHMNKGRTSGLMITR